MKKMIAFLLSFILMFSSVSAFAVSNEETDERRISYVEEIDEDLSYIMKCIVKVKKFFIFCFTFGGEASGLPDAENVIISSDFTSSDDNSLVPPESDTESLPPSDLP